MCLLKTILYSSRRLWASNADKICYLLLGLRGIISSKVRLVIFGKCSFPFNIFRNAWSFDFKLAINEKNNQNQNQNQNYFFIKVSYTTNNADMNMFNSISVLKRFFLPSYPCSTFIVIRVINHIITFNLKMLLCFFGHTV